MCCNNFQTNQANVFVHFSPIDHDEENEKYFNQAHKKISPKIARQMQQMKKTLADVRKKVGKVGGHEHDNHDEETIKRHLDRHEKANEEEQLEDPTFYIDNYAEEEEEGEGEEGEEGKEPDGRTALHVAAADGDLKEVEHLLKNPDSDILHSRDENGWQVQINSNSCIENDKASLL